MKRIIFILMLLILSSSVYAAAFTVDHENVKNLLLPEENAIFDVSIKNEQSFSDTVSFVISDLDWDWEKETFSINSKSTEYFTLELIPPEDIEAGRYTLALKVYSQSSPENYVYDNLVVDIFSYDDLISVESLESSLPGGLDPRKTNMVKLVLKNKHNIELEDVNVKLTSDLFMGDFSLDFDKAELKEISFDVNIDEDTVEGDYDVNVFIEMGDNILVDDVYKIKVAYYNDVQEDIQESKGFLIKKIKVKKINNGNSLVSESYSLRLNSFEKTFTYSNIEPSEIEKRGDGYYYIWNFNIKPGEEYVIDIKTNYRDPLLVLIVIVLIIYVLYTSLVKRVTLKKKVLTLKSTEGISEMKILLILKNKGRKVIKHIRLIDQLHNIAKSPNSFGSLKPTSVKRTADGVMLIWDIDNIVGGEERVISYRLKAGVSVIGKLRIPRALCRYKKGKRSVIVRSNSILIFS